MLLRSLILVLAITISGGALYAAMPGGYSAISIARPDVQHAANFAAATMNKGTLVRIVTAESQVVAGINYKMQLEIANTDGINHMYNAVVFVPLPSSKQPMQVTSVVEIVAD